MFEEIKRLLGRAVNALSNKQGLMSIGQVVENLKPNESGKKYVLEEVSDYEQYKGNLYITFKRYRGLRGRAFRLETLSDKLRITEIIEEQPKASNIREFEKPNIFNFATSELCQDAMFSWLIKWADDSFKTIDKQICLLGKKFLNRLTGIAINEIKSVSIKRQWKRIDILVIINEKELLIIEDKTGTSIHDNQLQKYKDIVNKKYDNKTIKLHCAYVKTENEPLDVERNIQKQGYEIISRNDLLTVLNEYKGNHPLIVDYRSHLQTIEDCVNSYLKLPVNKWGWYAWQGFYKELESNLKIDSWSYVSNPAGGFLGIWWHFVNIEDGNMYLQIEQGKLCFKIHYKGDKDCSSIRWKYHRKIIDNATRFGHNEIQKPDRFGAGTHMTVAIVNPEDLFGTQEVDIRKVVNNLKTYQSIIDILMMDAFNEQ